MPNTKILVNFKTKKCIHTEVHAGSREYQELIDRGYVNVGVIKLMVTRHEEIQMLSLESIKIFWDADYFEPQAKYIRPKTKVKY